MNELIPKNEQEKQQLKFLLTVVFTGIGLICKPALRSVANVFDDAEDAADRIIAVIPKE
jgi:hypothetical protein